MAEGATQISHGNRLRSGALRLAENACLQKGLKSIDAIDD